MEADGFGPNRNVDSIHSANFSFLQHSQDAVRRLCWIMQQRRRLRSGNKRTVAIIVAIRENFSCGWQSQFVRRSKQLGPGGREQDCACINGEYPVRDLVG